MTAQPISTSADWTFELLETYEREIGRIAADFELDTYPNQIEIISSEQMMDAYASAGMPINYHHWSFGKHYLGVENSYRRGHMGLAYEIAHLWIIGIALQQLQHRRGGAVARGIAVEGGDPVHQLLRIGDIRGVEGPFQGRFKQAALAAEVA